ncbi:MAG: NUDIX domain-containing protein [Oscillibacter sp.]|nr:NUDIX domain-containing protein [Oscillibacter sp.]
MKRVGPEFCYGAVLFQKEADGIKYLIIETSGGHISFPKGHMEEGETDPHAVAEREIREETGITGERFIDGFAEEYHYTSNHGNPKTVTYYLAELSQTNVTLQAEELKNYWYLPYDQALLLVNTPREKEILAAANVFLTT